MEETKLVRDSGIELVDGSRDPWDDIEILSEDGPGAFAVAPTPAPAEELAPDSPAALYLREISQRPLLTAEEEVQLAKEREAGEEAKQLLAQGVASQPARERLEAVFREGDAARRRLGEGKL